MTAEFNAIKRLLISGKRTTNRNPTWTRIHEETCCGTLLGREYQFTDSELQRLRQHAQSFTGLDPLLDSTAGGRMYMAEKVSDEKLANDSVFGQLVVMATAGKAQVRVGGEFAQIPSGTILSVPFDNLDLGYLHQQKIVIIENGALMPECQHIRLPKGWEDCVFVYRGHRENIRHTQKLIEGHPAEHLGLFFDFDPAGLGMALALGKGCIFIPEDGQELSIALEGDINNRSAFRRQSRELSRLRDKATEINWKSLVDWLEKKEIAIMQEHLVRRNLPLVTFDSAT